MPAKSSSNSIDTQKAECLQEINKVVLTAIRKNKPLKVLEPELHKIFLRHLRKAGDEAENLKRQLQLQLHPDKVQSNSYLTEEMLSYLGPATLSKRLNAAHDRLELPAELDFLPKKAAEGVLELKDKIPGFSLLFKVIEKMATVPRPFRFLLGRIYVASWVAILAPLLIETMGISFLHYLDVAIRQLLSKLIRVNYWETTQGRIIQDRICIAQLSGEEIDIEECKVPLTYLLKGQLHPLGGGSFANSTRWQILGYGLSYPLRLLAGLSLVIAALGIKISSGILYLAGSVTFIFTVPAALIVRAIVDPILIAAVLIFHDLPLALVAGLKKCCGGRAKPASAETSAAKPKAATPRADNPQQQQLSKEELRRKRADYFEPANDGAAPSSSSTATVENLRGTRQEQIRLLSQESQERQTCNKYEKRRIFDID